MSTISTVAVKENECVKESAKRKRSKSDYFTTFISICLWTTAALITAAHTNISPNASGIAVSVTTQDVLAMLITTWLLTKGLNESCNFYLIPWLLLSLWNLYFVHFKSLLEFAQAVDVVAPGEAFPWMMLLVDMIGFAVRVVLILITTQLIYTTWYYKKIKNTQKN